MYTSQSYVLKSIRLDMIFKPHQPAQGIPGLTLSYKNLPFNSNVMYVGVDKKKTYMTNK